jgi:hypothetical protein
MRFKNSNDAYEFGSTNYPNTLGRKYLLMRIKNNPFSTSLLITQSFGGHTIGNASNIRTGNVNTFDPVQAK